MYKNTAKRLPNIPCVIIAAGRARRFGSNKAFARLGGVRLIDLLIEQIRRQNSGPIAINGEEISKWMEFGCPILKDKFQGGLGPLVGIHTAMSWARELGAETVITTPVDTPILPNTFVEQLCQTGAPAIAKHSGRLHCVHGIWPVNLASELAKDISQGMRAVHEWTTKISASECVFPIQPGSSLFFNVNTQDDLKHLEKNYPIHPR